SSSFSLNSEQSPFRSNLKRDRPSRYHADFGSAPQLGFVSFCKHHARDTRSRADDRSDARAFRAADCAAYRRASRSAAANVDDIAFLGGLAFNVVFSIDPSRARVLQLGQRAIELMLCSVGKYERIELQSEPSFAPARTSGRDRGDSPLDDR